MIVVDVKRAQIVERCRSRGGIVTGVDSVISQSAGWGAVAVCAYLLPGLLATLVAESVGTAGRFTDIALSLYPRVTRSALQTVVAAVVGLVGTLAGAAAAEAGGPHPPAPPVVAPATPPPDPLDWPVHTSQAPAPAAATRPTPPATAGATVHPGDSLWRIAARALGRHATPAATAAAWPRWWAANRTAVGDDPDLLRPGLRLRAPHTHGRSGS